MKNLDQLPEKAQFIVADMVFNIGSGGFTKFKGTIAALERRDFLTAADEMKKSIWYKKGVKRPQHHVEIMRSLDGL